MVVIVAVVVLKSATSKGLYCFAVIVMLGVEEEMGGRGGGGRGIHEVQNDTT